MASLRALGSGSSCSPPITRSTRMAPDHDAAQRCRTLSKPHLQQPADHSRDLAGHESLLARSTDIISGSELDVVAYGCTSASMAIGEERVFEHIRSVRPGAKCTTPITAAFAAFRAFGAKRIGLLTPYRADVNRIVASYVTARGFEVPVFGSFNEENNRGRRRHQSSVDPQGRGGDHGESQARCRICVLHLGPARRSRGGDRGRWACRLPRPTMRWPGTP